VFKNTIRRHGTVRPCRWPVLVIVQLIDNNKDNNNNKNIVHTINKCKPNDDVMYKANTGIYNYYALIYEVCEEIMLVMLVYRFIKLHRDGYKRNWSTFVSTTATNSRDVRSSRTSHKEVMDMWPYTTELRGLWRTEVPLLRPTGLFSPWLK